MSELRRKAWEWREELSQHPLTPKRTRGCSATRFDYCPSIEREGESAWWRGVVRCRSRYCPPCWLTRRAKLAQEVNWVESQWRARHSTQPLLATLTVRHDRSDSERIVLNVRKAWRALLQSRVWQGFRADYGAELCASEEITWTEENGWHPHMHVLLLPRRNVERADLSWLSEAWRARVRRKLGAQNEPDSAHGTDIRHCHVAEYVSKLGFELSDAGAAKTSITPLRLLELGELDRYARLQHVRSRARDATWSRGLKEIRDAMPKPAPGTRVFEALPGTFDAAARKRLRLLAALEASERGLDPFETLTQKED